MSTLAEFLKEQGERIREEGPIRDKDRTEWVAAIEKLFAQFEKWIEGVEGHNLLKITRSDQKVTEVRLGAYSVQRLKIELDGSFVEFIPVQRFAGGAIRPEGYETAERISGLVTVSESGDPFQHLYRVGTGENSHWYVSAGQRDGEIRYELLTQVRFERLLVRGLQ